MVMNKYQVTNSAEVNDAQILAAVEEAGYSAVQAA